MLKSISFLVFLLFPVLAFADISQEFVRDNAIRVKTLSKLPRTITKQIQGYKVITVGEMHGTNESPKFILGLVKLLAKTNKSVALGLEIPYREQPNIDKFIKTGDLNLLKGAPFFTRDFQDGRSSKAMANLLAQLRKIKNLRVVCFDPAPDDTSGQDRDTKMALALRDVFVKMKPDVLVVLAGNIHASLSIGTSWDPQYRPTGYELYSLPDSPIMLSDILAIRIRNIKGSAWVCYTNQPCGVTNVAEEKNNYSEAVPWDSFFLKEANIVGGYNSTFFSRAISASLPLKGTN